MKKFFAFILAVVLLLSVTAFAASPAMNYVYVTGTTNVRSGPGGGYSKVAALKEGSTVDYLWQTRYDSRGVAWYRVSVGTGNAIGWVVSEYAYLTNTPGTAVYGDGANAGSSATDTSHLWNVIRVVVTGNVNVRTGPGTNYEVIRTMAKGEKATYLGNTAYDDRGVMWYQVNYKNTVGWVSSTYAELENDPSAATGVVEVTGKSANVRTGPGLNYKTTGSVKRGETLNYAGNSFADDRGVVWYEVSYKNGFGWISSAYAELKNNGVVLHSWVKIEGGNANVRTGAGLGNKSIGTAYEGESLSYLGKSSVDERGVTWYRVSFNGQNGWVSSTYAKLY